MGEMCLQNGQKFVLIGDSITDCGRRGEAAPYGYGYMSMVRALVLAGWPERNIAWLNKGISGDTVTDLQARWEDDVIREQPDWLSIKVGINDLHCHLRSSGGEVSPALFRATYEEILTRTVAKTKAQLILLTPFYLSTDRSDNSFRSQVLDLLPEYIAIVEELAEKFMTRLVNLQTMFERQLQHRSPDEFCPEPVHPNAVGHLLIAQEVMQELTG